MEWLDFFANFLSILYSILARHVSLFSLHVQENVTYILKYTKFLSLSCAKVYSRMFKLGF